MKDNRRKYLTWKQEYELLKDCGMPEKMSTKLTGYRPKVAHCFSCKKDFKSFRGVGDYRICLECLDKFFTRPNGTLLQGMDWTREIARIRDNHQCQKCLKKWKLGTRRFDIHHLYACGEKSRSYDRLTDIHDLTTLCHKCHLNLDSVIKKMSEKSSPRPDSQKLYQAEWKQSNKPWLK